MMLKASAVGLLLMSLILMTSCDDHPFPGANYGPVIKHLNSKPFDFVGEEIEIEGVAVDVDQDELTFSWTNG